MNLKTLCTTSCLVATTVLLLTTTLYAANEEQTNATTATQLVQTSDPVPQDIASIRFDQASAEGRKSYNNLLRNDIIAANLAKPLNAENEREWAKAFGCAQYLMCRNETIFQSIRHALATSSERSDELTRAALEAAYTLYPSELKPEVEKIANHTENTKNFAMAVHYLLQVKPGRAKEFYDLSTARFKGREDEPLLAQLRLHLEKPFAERLKDCPPLLDLLSRRFPEDASVIFSFQRANRDYPGLVVVRKQDGTFLRRPDGSLFAVTQLARSLSNMPGYLTNGNTPQGIYSIQRYRVLDFIELIGPTPTIRLVLPNEESVGTYFHDQSREDEKWKPELYRKMLPPSWRDYAPIFEAYAAGEIGRCDIVAHGSIKDSELYSGTPYYPNMPTHGCLASLERWSKDGNCIYSDQLALLKAYSSLNSPMGYYVVVDLNNEPRPVNLYEILSSLLEAESQDAQ